MTPTASACPTVGAADLGGGHGCEPRQHHLILPIRKVSAGVVGRLHKPCSGVAAGAM